MSYIGKTPTPAPLTSSDITDGIITTTKIADANVTNPKLTSGSQQNFRNIIINGDMSIAQRGTSTSSITSSGYNTVDRFRTGLVTLGTWTQTQSTDVPTGQGFAKSMKLDCTTADASPASGDLLFFQQRIEGQNLQYLKKGTSSTESLTASFWVKSNKTGTYILELYDTDNTRSISKSYTISSANTWEKKTITYDGDTSGAFANDNGGSLRFNFWLGAGTDYSSGTLATSWNSLTNANRAVGQVNLADSTSNEWYVTGVQLEAGTSASDFEFLPYDVNLRRCQRYYQLITSGSSDIFGTGFNYNSSQVRSYDFYYQEMRGTPSLDIETGSDYYSFLRNGAVDNLNTFELDGRTNKKSYGILNSTEASGTSGQAGFLRTNNASAYIAFDAEL